jgi:Domain of unknown function (DUF4331)
MSHDLEPPPARQDPRLNIADHYVFDACAATALVMNVSTTSGKDQRLDPFHPRSRYEFKIHLDNHDYEDVTYRLSFLPGQAGQQPYSLERLAGVDARNDEAAGTVLARGITGECIGTHDGGQVWAGAAVNPFYLDVQQMRQVDGLVRHGADVDLSRWVHGVAVDTFNGSTVQSIVLTVPVGTDGLTTGRQIGTWSTSRLAGQAGGWRQVGRSGLPMICDLFRLGEDDARLHGQTHPADDPATYGPVLADLVASTVERLRTSDRAHGYADSLMERIVPDLLHYVVGSPAVFGFARFNGRRLGDNAPEVMFSLATNSAVTTGLKAADVQRNQERFPFVIPR